jgi:hypothetical protein
MRRSKRKRGRRNGKSKKQPKVGRWYKEHRNKYQK